MGVNQRNSTLMTIAIFKVQPLELKVNIPIDRKVGGWGGGGEEEAGV